jgi:type I site-specific restriction-modification system R (restriction) subunit
MNLNRKLFGDSIQNYTAVCESVLDKSVMKLYHEIKESEEDEEEEDECEEDEEEEDECEEDEE